MTHSATYDIGPEQRHTLHITPHGERLISVVDYEHTTGK